MRNGQRRQGQGRNTKAQSRYLHRRKDLQPPLYQDIARPPDQGQHRQGQVINRGRRLGLAHGAKVAIIFTQNSAIQPSVSIIIPVRNGARFLRRAVASALAQTHPPLEVIVVDNNSTDATPVIIAELAAQHPTVVAAECKRQGAPAARNHGLNVAKGEWVQFLDADDELLPDKLKKQLAAADKDTQWIIGGYRNLFANGGTLDNLPHPDPWKGLVFQYRIGYTVANLFRRDLLLPLGGWDESLRSNQDPELHFMLLRAGATFLLVPEILCHYHHHGADQITRTDPIGRYRRKVQMLERVNTFLASQQPLYWAKHHPFFTGALLRAIRMYATYDLGAAAGAYDRMKKQGFMGRPELIAPWILLAYRFLGFRRTEQLRLRLRRLFPAHLKKWLKNT